MMGPCVLFIRTTMRLKSAIRLAVGENPGSMWERFTDRARKVMQLAELEASRLNHEYIGTEHILLGLIAERFGVAGHVLQSLGVDLQKARRKVEERVPPLTTRRMSGALPIAPRAGQVIALSHEDAAKLQHNYVGTEHLLLGLTRDCDGVAAEMLVKMGLKLESVRDEVLNRLGHSQLM